MLGTTCLLADGHKVAAFAENKPSLVSSTTAGEIAVLDGDEASATFRQMISRIDLCNPSRETCNTENPTSTTAFTPNSSSRIDTFVQTDKKIYSYQEGYGQIVEIDPVSLVIIEDV